MDASGLYSHPGGFYLGEFHVDPDSGAVTDRVGTRHLSPRATRALLCLCGRAGSVVSREELHRFVWGNDDDRRDLTHVIGEVRKALDDHADDPKLIETVPRRGYRLLVEPVRIAAAGTTAAGDLEPPSPPRVGFLNELKRRGVLETAVAYLVCGWLLIQVADATFEPLSLPPWAATFVTYLVIVGFPIALVLAWFIEITAHGAVLDLDPGARPRRKPFSRSYIAIVGALVLASAGVLAYDRFFGLPREIASAEALQAVSPIEVDPNTIAVLPFRNISDTEEGRIFSDGLAEDIIDRLSRISGLSVSSRGDSFSLAPNSTSEQVRQRLQVAYYLEGSVRLVGDSLRIVVQLIDSERGFHAMSRTFNRERRDFFAIQDEITRLTVANLRVALPEGTRASIVAAGDDTDLDAYVLYRRGVEALHAPTTPETIGEALDAFSRALSVDPGYAAANGGICQTYVEAYRVMKEPMYIDEAETACAAALSSNANLDVVHNALGELYAEIGRYEDAEQAFLRALRINPGSVDSLIGLGAAYQEQQQQVEAEATLRRALGLRPGNWQAHNALGDFLWRNGRYAEAASQYREIVSLDIGNATGWTKLAAMLMLSGQFRDATRAFERAIAIEPRADSYANLGLLHYYLGEIPEAVAALEEAVDRSPGDHLYWSNLGDVLSFSAEPERARGVFERAEALAASALGINSRNPQTMIDLAWIKAMLGKFDEAEQLMATARGLAPEDPYVPYIDALIMVRRGDEAAAMEKLRSAADMGFSRTMIAAEPHLSVMNDMPEFNELVAEHAQ